MRIDDWLKSKLLSHFPVRMQIDGEEYVWNRSIAGQLVMNAAGDSGKPIAWFSKAYREPETGLTVPARLVMRETVREDNRETKLVSFSLGVMGLAANIVVEMRSWYVLENGCMVGYVEKEYRGGCTLHERGCSNLRFLFVYPFHNFIKSAVLSRPSGVALDYIHGHHHRPHPQYQ